VRFNKGTIRMLFVTEPNRLKVLAGKILALTTSIAIRKRLINHAPAEEHLFGAPVEDPLTALRTRCSVGRERLVVHSTISSMGDDDVDRPEPPSAKAVTAMLREARSLSRRADKLSGTAAAVDDPTTQQLAAEACTSMEQLVHHLMVLERQLQRGEKSASRRL
jgi:hypothetical protein